MHPLSLPLLSCAEAKVWEEGWFAGDGAKEWAAILRAGRAVADAVFRDFAEAGAWPAAPRFLILVGKGHNGADALVAAGRLAELLPSAHFDLAFVFGSSAVRPQAARAWRTVEPRLRGRSSEVSAPQPAYTVVIDGVFGHSYRPPLPPVAARWLQRVNALDARLRAAVDLPSGLGEPDGFYADFTYATGILKAEVARADAVRQTGRIRFLDIGLFGSPAEFPVGPGARVLLPSVLDPVRRLRPAVCDKRDHGHLLVLGGSLRYPGAVLMTVRAALKAGAGLVTAFVPEPLAPAFAAAVPEAMWVGWPVTPEGSLALEGLYLARREGSRGTAWVMGPGLGREPETLALVEALVAEETRPVVLDADALQRSVLKAARGPLVLTPHAGEWERIRGEQDAGQLARETGAVVVAKGAPTWVITGENEFLVPAGGPVLARGGSGDLLAGMVGGRLAQGGANRLSAVCSAVYWHGVAADALARVRGATAVRTTELLDFLPPVLREET